MTSGNRLPGLFGDTLFKRKKLFRWLSAVMLLFLLAWFVDVGEAIRQLAQTDWRWLVPAMLIIQIQVVLSAVRWRMTAARLGQSLTLQRATSEYYLATVANLSLPGGVTGDAARVYRNRQAADTSVAVHGVVLERLAGQIALLLVVVLGWLLWPALMQADMPVLGARVLGVTVGLLVLMGLACFLVVRFAPDRITHAVLSFGPSFRAVWWSDRQWMGQGILSLIIVITYLLVFLLCSYAIQAPLPLSAVITVVPLVLLSMLVPLSIGGWGIRETAAAVLWPVIGLSSEIGIATSIVYALISLVGCIPGLLLYLFKASPDYS